MGEKRGRAKAGVEPAEVKDAGKKRGAAAKSTTTVDESQLEMPGLATKRNAAKKAAAKPEPKSKGSPAKAVPAKKGKAAQPATPKKGSAPKSPAKKGGKGQEASPRKRARSESKDDDDEEEKEEEKVVATPKRRGRPAKVQPVEKEEDSDEEEAPTPSRGRGRPATPPKKQANAKQATSPAKAKAVVKPAPKGRPKKAEVKKQAVEEEEESSEDEDIPAPVLSPSRGPAMTGIFPSVDMNMDSSDDEGPISIPALPIPTAMPIQLQGSPAKGKFKPAVHMGGVKMESLFRTPEEPKFEPPVPEDSSDSDGEMDLLVGGKRKAAGPIEGPQGSPKKI
eukprot:Colp12_sorted_trinity150504_noHs@24766